MESGKKRKKPAPSQPPYGLVLDSCTIGYCPFLCHHSVYSTGIFRSRIPSMVAQTMVRQLISVMNTSVDLVGALAHIALRDSRSRWWCGYSGAWTFSLAIHLNDTFY